tara:strand:- start:1724 stop:2848 length:1125 start_codon:yes stop_codon:yes gene_type:complete
MKKELARLIHLLASGEPVSGRVIGEEIGVSRTSVSNWVSQLADYGITVNSQAGVGYCLPRPLGLLQPDVVQRRVGQTMHRVFQLEILESVDSTNIRALEALQAYLGGRATADLVYEATVSKFAVAVAEYQTSGRGRRGRSWVSPFAANINLSLAVRVNQALGSLSGLSLAIGMAIVQVLRRYGFSEVGLKWPNDVLLHGRKLAGILVDAQGEMEGPVDLSIGVGLNVMMQSSDVDGLISQPWASLEQAASAKGITVPDRSLLVADLITEIVRTSELFASHGFGYFQPEWSLFDAFHGEILELTSQLEPDSGQSMGGNRLPLAVGQNAGVDEQGRLLLRKGENTDPIAFAGGEVSVRKHSVLQKVSGHSASQGGG